MLKYKILWNENKGRLVLINMPTYSPHLNPQENIWNFLKNKIFTKWFIYRVKKNNTLDKK